MAGRLTSGTAILAPCIIMFSAFTNTDVAGGLRHVDRQLARSLRQQYLAGALRRLGRLEAELRQARPCPPCSGSSDAMAVHASGAMMFM